MQRLLVIANFLYLELVSLYSACSYIAGDIHLSGHAVILSDHAERMWDMDETLLFQVPDQYECLYNMNLNGVKEL